MSSDYFVNHRRASRFPWSLYHRPLEDSLAHFLSGLARSVPAPRVLVIGAGYLHELPSVPENVRLTAVDIDARVVDRLRGIQDPRIERCLTVMTPEDLQAFAPFAGIYAKEVIEHILEVEPFLRVLVSLLAPGGRIWLSTPNYGDPVLPVLESTVLELIGRLSGYSRKAIHPTRFSLASLEGALKRAGLADVTVVKTPYRLALVGTGLRLPGGPESPRGISGT